MWQPWKKRDRRMPGSFLIRWVQRHNPPCLSPMEIGVHTPVVWASSQQCSNIIVWVETMPGSFKAIGCDGDITPCLSQWKSLKQLPYWRCFHTLVVGVGIESTSCDIIVRVETMPTIPLASNISRWATVKAYPCQQHLQFPVWQSWSDTITTIVGHFMEYRTITTIVGHFMEYRWI